MLRSTDSFKNQSFHKVLYGFAVQSICHTNLLINGSENQHTSQAWCTLRVDVFRSCVLSSFRRAVISVQMSKGRFTQYDFVARNLLTHVYDTKKSRRILKHALKPYDNRGLKCVVSVL